ncbi:hypothetical protein [Paraliobacillus ryukyuensis]|uniref:hypothetical protein n=1 Tax=Paraliobacillus ryukyuensis TaxID=200904 RepID=UPI0015C466CB|nr:hypothetical protein [Paraliobacillus ryukyuensis]
MSKQTTKVIKGKETKGTYLDDDTIYIEGIGKVTKTGELDLRQFIRNAMALPSFNK